MNTGVIIQQNPTDFIAGTIPYEAVCDDWTPYLPSDEKQIGLYFDTMACVTFSLTNVIETQLNRMIVQNIMPDSAFRFLSDNGYFQNGKLNFSDRFTAKMSGTTKSGNTLQAVLDSVRHHGLLPESDWSYDREQRTPVFDWDDYYSEIPQNLKDKAKGILDYMEISYEWLFAGILRAYQDGEMEEFKKHLKQAPCQIASPTCDWKSVVKPCGKTTSSHATEIYKIDEYFQDYDSYNPFKKQLSLDFIIPYVMKIVVKLKPNIETMTNVKLGKKGQEISFVVPVTNPEALKAMAMNYGITVPTLPDGSVDWVKLKVDYIIQ